MNHNSPSRKEESFYTSSASAQASPQISIFSSIIPYSFIIIQPELKTLAFSRRDDHTNKQLMLVVVLKCINFKKTKKILSIILKMSLYFLLVSPCPMNYI